MGGFCGAFTRSRSETSAPAVRPNSLHHRPDAHLHRIGQSGPGRNQTRQEAIRGVRPVQPGSRSRIRSRVRSRTRDRTRSPTRTNTRDRATDRAFDRRLIRAGERAGDRRWRTVTTPPASGVPKRVGAR